MGWQARQNAIRARMMTLSPTANLAWDAFTGIDYLPPVPDPVSPSVASVWARLSLGGGLAEPLGFGSGLLIDRKDGISTIQLFAPKGLAPAIVEPMAETCALIFRNVTVAGVRFGPSSDPVRIASAEKTPFLQINITNPYIVDEAFAEAA